MQTISFLFYILLHVSTSEAACAAPAEGNCGGGVASASRGAAVPTKNLVLLGTKTDPAECQAACKGAGKAGCCSYNDAVKECTLDTKGLSIPSTIYLASKKITGDKATAAEAEMEKQRSGMCNAEGTCKPLVSKSVCDEGAAFHNVETAETCMTQCATIPEATCCQWAVDKTSKKHCHAKFGTATQKSLAGDAMMSKVLTEWKSAVCTAKDRAQNSVSSALSDAVSASWTSLSGEQWVKIVALLEFLFAGFLTLKYCTMKQSQQAQMSYTLLKEQEA